MARGKIIKNDGISAARGIYPVSTGIIEDLETRKQYSFEQPLFNELGLAINAKATFSIITDETGSEIAVGLEAIDKGEVLSITADGGTLKNRFTGEPVEFAHSRVKEASIVVGSRVRFEKVDFNGKPVASGVTLIR